MSVMKMKSRFKPDFILNLLIFVHFIILGSKLTGGIRSGELTRSNWNTHTHVCFCELWGHSLGINVFILYKLYVLLLYT